MTAWSACLLPTILIGLPHFKASYLRTAEGYDHLANDLEFLAQTRAKKEAC
jgi:hypothetical protein